MKNLLVLLCFLSFAASARADLVQKIKIEKLNCDGTASAEKEIPTSDSTTYQPIPPSEPNFLFVNIDIDNTGNAPASKVEFKSTPEGSVLSSDSMASATEAIGGTEGGPAYTQFVVDKDMWVTLQDLRESPNFYKALVDKTPGSKQVDISGYLQISSFQGKKYERFGMQYKVNCKLQLSRLQMTLPFSEF